MWCQVAVGARNVICRRLSIHPTRGYCNGSLRLPGDGENDDCAGPVEIAYAARLQFVIDFTRPTWQERPLPRIDLQLLWPCRATMIEPCTD